MKLWRVVALMTAALTLTMSSAHVLEMPQKRRGRSRALQFESKASRPRGVFALPIRADRGEGTAAPVGRHGARRDARPPSRSSIRVHPWFLSGLEIAD